MEKKLKFNFLQFLPNKIINEVDLPSVSDHEVGPRRMQANNVMLKKIIKFRQSTYMSNLFLLRGIGNIKYKPIRAPIVESPLCS